MFVIAGFPDCRKYAQAINVANYLNEKLPDFVFVCVSKLGREWNVINHISHKGKISLAVSLFSELFDGLEQRKRVELCRESSNLEGAHIGRQKT